MLDALEIFIWILLSLLSISFIFSLFLVARKPMAGKRKKDKRFGEYM
ncbi:hypothetical protein [Neobacillus sp.]|nr:hypothetical protein [Neobacillus sp.]